MLTDRTGINVDDLQFQGFDHNNETDHLCYARFLNSEGQYGESNAFDSHARRLGMYRRMLAEFSGLEKDKFPLDGPDIRSVLAAMVHPEHR
jgi:uncharacterized protein YfbU (UPF0304 family)